MASMSSGRTAQPIRSPSLASRIRRPKSLPRCHVLVDDRDQLEIGVAERDDPVGRAPGGMAASRASPRGRTRTAVGARRGSTRRGRENDVVELHRAGEPAFRRVGLGRRRRRLPLPRRPRAMPGRASCRSCRGRSARLPRCRCGRPRRDPSPSPWRALRASGGWPCFLLRATEKARRRCSRSSGSGSFASGAGQASRLSRTSVTL